MLLSEITQGDQVMDYMDYISNEDVFSGENADLFHRLGEIMFSHRFRFIDDGGWGRFERGEFVFYIPGLNAEGSMREFVSFAFVDQFDPAHRSNGRLSVGEIVESDFDQFLRDLIP